MNPTGHPSPRPPDDPGTPLHASRADRDLRFRRVLVVDADGTLRDSCTSVLRQESYRVAACASGVEASGLIERGEFDILLLDWTMPESSGLDLLRSALRANPAAVVVVMTGNPDVESSVRALREGAWDYLPKPFTATHLLLLLGRARHARLTDGAEGRGGEPPRGASIQTGELALLGRSPVFLKMVQLAEKVAQTNASVFLTGESGSGKEVVAQFIHHRSRRSGLPMVAINCAALPETLLESEMFGHAKGAFTGAIRDKAGLLETAHGGTLFLDELTEMSQPIQAKLLRVIQDGIVRRVGSETLDAKVDVRFIAATNRDARTATQEGVLRKDLYYRLSVVPIHVPPLRERVGDIPLLAKHFLCTYWLKHRDRGSPIPTFTEAALRELQARTWPGNVRELQNVMEHAVVLLEPESRIRPEDIPYLGGTACEEDDPVRTQAPGEGMLVPGQFAGEYHAARERIVQEFESAYLTALISRAGANMSRAAKMAGVDRTTLYRLMEKHGLQRDTMFRCN